MITHIFKNGVVTKDVTKVSVPAETVSRVREILERREVKESDRKRVV